MISIVYGTRPEAIKLAPVIDALRARGARLRVICTGQHQELLDAIPIAPDVELRLMRPEQSQAEFLSRALLPLDANLLHSRFVFVQGDTVSAFAGALVASLLRIPVGHVEAGLRTYRLDAPFPEEGYRQMIDRIATRLYAPTEWAATNLKSEGRDAKDVLVTGNTGVDAALRATSGRRIPNGSICPFVFVTIHRREAEGRPVENICRAVRRLAAETDLSFFVTTHPNAIGLRVRELLFGEPKINLFHPLSHADTLATMKEAVCVITDSGGLQEECPTFGVPVVVAREVTERPEGVLENMAVLAGFDESLIVASVKAMRYRDHVPKSVYGDGHAGERIADDVLRQLKDAT